MKKNLYKQIFENVSFNYLGQFLTSIFSLFITIYIIRSFSIEEFGYYQLLMSAVPFVMMLTSMGIPSIIQRYIPEFYETGNFSNIKKIVSVGLISRIFAVGLALLVAGLFIDQILSLLNAPALKEYLALFGLALLVLVEISTIQSVLTALFLQKYNVLVDSIGSGLRFVLYYHALQTGQGLKGIIFYFLIINLILFIAYLVTIYFQIYKVKSSTQPSPPFFKRVFKYGLFSYFNEASYSFYDTSIDFYIISFFLGPTQVGYYSFAVITLKRLICWLPTQMISNLIIPIFTRRYHEKGSRDELDIMFKLYNKTYAFIMFPAMIALLVLADKIIIHVFDPKYLTSLYIFYLFVLFEIINSPLLGMGEVAKVLEKANIIFYSRVSAVYNLLAAIVLIKYYGLWGVAFATGSALFMNRLIVYILTRKYISTGPSWISLVRILFNSIIMGILIYIGRPFISGIPILLLSTFIGAFIYAIISLINNAFNGQEKQIFKNTFRWSAFSIN